MSYGRKDGDPPTESRVIPFTNGDCEVEEHRHTCAETWDDGECLACGMRDCPHGEPLHYHHDGCPACY